MTRVDRTAVTRASAQTIINYLASMPDGSQVASRDVARQVLLDTGAELMAGGFLYEIKLRSLGAGIYRITLAPWSKP